MFDRITMTEMWFLARAIAFCALVICLFANQVVSKPLVVERIDNSSCPRIISREEWGARNATSPHVPMKYRPTPYVVVHHGGILHYCYDQPGCSEIVRSYQNLHIDVNGWIDIGYQFVIGEDGNVYEGRGWDNVGAHSPGYNTQSIGISIIGDFSHFVPNKPALHALEDLIACGIQLGKISKDYKVIGHRQARNTVCPGEEFYGWVQKMPNWTGNPKPVFTNASVATAAAAAGDNWLDVENVPKD